MDYSKTVNLPRTDFPMKANLPNREPEFHKYWEEHEIYNKISQRDDAKGTFVFHDGPPYSNGDIHMGHALNKSLKDFIARYKAMTGYRVPYIPGWDNHGLPIEQKVAEEFRKKKQNPSKLELRKACRIYAEKWVGIQREQLKRLGLLSDWDHPYLTMSREYEATIIKVFGEMMEKGYIYRGLRPIYWCTNDETALAEAEIEYADHTSHSIFVRFPLVCDPNGIFERKENAYTIIWTTTPWTIPANLAVAVHPDYEYAVVDVAGDRYLIAAELVSRTMEAAEVAEYCVVKTVKGSELEGLVFKHPIYDRESVLTHANYVTLEDGTGIVHTAPGHGREDFETGKKYGLEALNPVDERGYFTEAAGQFEGLHITRQGNQAVIDAMRENGSLMAESSITHSYPHCWRCHKPVIFRATEQWFVSIDHDDLRKRILNEIESSVRCFPKEGRNRLYAMIESSPDWCLSRQRSWGVAIPVLFCDACREPVLSKDVIDLVYADALENGSDSWFEKDASEFVPAGFKCAVCGCETFVKEEDVLDVWFDSGSSCRAVTERLYGDFVADVYLEGSDQHRGWFNKSIIVGTATKGASPFKDLVTHGYVLDAEGKKMSKSGGNTIAPKEVTKHFGADILRLYISSLNYFEDVRFGQEMFTRAVDAYRRIRNTFRFILGNLSDFDPDNDAVDYADMPEIDKFALHRLAEFTAEVTKAYEVYEFHKVYHAVHNYCAVDLSGFYLDVLKDRLYASAADSDERRCAQSALYHILSVLTRVVAPVLVHTSEEAWLAMPGESKAESVHLAPFAEADSRWIDSELAGRWGRILEVRDRVLAALEEARQSGAIGKPLESRIIVSAEDELLAFLKGYEGILPSVFIVSQVELRQADELAVEVQAPAGAKCARCWLVLESVGTNEEHPELCSRCAEAIAHSH
ncbi:MAG: isoleucine--tRNA ligase [Armatimonadetes bacterium]|jgi:isoleucyl-tRNA synthetase|nr:isoleucine--tRNA ligase [Armatimonadota bacterium]